MKPEQRKLSKRNRHNGRINAAKALILNNGTIVVYSDGTRYAKDWPYKARGYMQVRLP